MPGEAVSKLTQEEWPPQHDLDAAAALGDQQLIAGLVVDMGINSEQEPERGLAAAWALRELLGGTLQPLAVVRPDQAADLAQKDARRYEFASRALKVFNVIPSPEEFIPSPEELDGGSDGK